MDAWCRIRWVEGEEPPDELTRTPSDDGSVDDGDDDDNGDNEHNEVNGDNGNNVNNDDFDLILL